MKKMDESDRLGSEGNVRAVGGGELERQDWHRSRARNVEVTRRANKLPDVVRSGPLATGL